MTTDSWEGSERVIDISAARRPCATAPTEFDVVSSYEIGACRAQARVFSRRADEIEERRRRAEERAATAQRMVDEANTELNRALQEVEARRLEAVELAELKVKSEERAVEWKWQWEGLKQRWNERAALHMVTRPKLLALLGIGYLSLMADVARTKAAGALILLVALAWLARHLTEDMRRS